MKEKRILSPLQKIKLDLRHLEFNRKKLNAERRMINLIIGRMYMVERKMGKEYAYDDLKAYLRKWKDSTERWRDQTGLDIQNITQKLCEYNMEERE